MLCPPSSGCGCAFQSSTLNISVDPDGTWQIEQAEFTSLAALQADVDSLKAWRTTATAQISALEATDVTHGAAITRFDAMTAGKVFQNAAGVGPTSGTTTLVIASAVVTTPTAGKLIWGGHAYYNKTVSTDHFTGQSRLDAVSQASVRDASVSTVGGVSGASGATLSTAGTVTLDFGIWRSSGSGTATTAAFNSAGQLWWLFIPD